MSPEPTRVLFVCTGNAGRSQMAAALFARLAGSRAVVFSAGVDPWDHLHPVAVRLLAARGIDISACRPKHVRTLAHEPFDVVVTIGEPARNKTPEMRDNPRRLHWPIKDPADADLKGPARQEAAFRIAMADIEARLGPLMQGIRNPASCTEGALSFLRRQRIPEGRSGAYRYAEGCRQPTLYSSCYAAMGLGLCGELGALTSAERADWVAALQGHQDSDGLFRDPVIFDQGWYKDDPLWCGRPHLTCHVIAALTCLGGVAAKPLTWLDPWRDPAALVRWLESRDWGERVGWTGNEIMNVGVLLQYARDFQHDTRAGKAVSALLEWLSTRHVNPATGVWGHIDVSDPKWRSHAVQAAYHWWPLFFYDGVPIPHVEQAVDTVLATQNPEGGFGWGVHHASEPFMSSACEDIDSIDPLCRMMAVTDYRREEIRAVLNKAADWVLTNQMPDGGFVFMRNAPFEYGHSELRGEVNQGAMFPTWFRMLSLALIGKAMPDHALGRIPWQFVSCPGMQFWGHPGKGERG